MADDFVQITVKSDSLPTRKTLTLSFRRAGQFDPSLILAEIEELLYDDELENYFLGPITVEFHVVRMPAGNGRARKRGMETFETFCQSRRSVLEISNTDNLCLPRSLVVGIAREAHFANKTDKVLERRFKSISRKSVNNVMQKVEALSLCAKASVSTNECGTMDALQKFRHYLKDYVILVYQYQSDQIVLVSGDVAAENASKKRLFLLNENNHYNVITLIKALYSKDFFCDKCLTAYARNQVHKCNDFCYHCLRAQKCTGDEKTCNQCLRVFANCFDYHLESTSTKKSLCERIFHCKDCLKLIDMSKRKETHICNEVYCTVCKKFNPYGHRCFIQVIKDDTKLTVKPVAKRARKDTPDKVYVFFDFECIQTKQSTKRNAFEHEAILCVSEITCEQCMDELESDYQCSLCGCFGSRRQVFFGANAASQFLDYLGTLHKVKSVCLLCHNSSGYDNQLLLKDIMAKDATWVPELIVQGTRIIQMKLFNLNFLDSLNFIPIALSKFAATFSLGENKGHFPHFVLNCVENNFDINCPYETNLVLKHDLPPPEAYGSCNMTAKDKVAFERWYESELALKKGFNFIEDMKRYCYQDVNVLRRGCMAFRKIFLDIAQVEPFACGYTIAGVCSYVYRKQFMPKDCIGVIPEFGYRLCDKQSKVALEWLAWIGSSRNIKIDSAMNGQEPKVFKFKVDGQCGKEVFFFHGCFFHGCPDCFPLNRNKILYGDPSQTFNNRFTNTMKITNRLKGEGFRVTEIFECDWTKLKKDKPGIKVFLEQKNIKEKIVSPLNPRDAFFGGRVSTLRTYHQTTGTEKIHYVDVTSLYPL